MSAASTTERMKSLAAAERARAEVGDETESFKASKPGGCNRPKPLPPLSEEAATEQMKHGLDAAGLPTDTELTPKQRERATRWPKGLRNGALRIYIMEGKTLKQQTEAAVNDRKKKTRAAKANGNGKANDKPVKPREWHEVNQPDVDFDVKGDFAAYLIDGDALRFIGAFPASSQSTRPAQAIRLAISELDGYDVEKAKAAEFITCRTRYLRKTLAIA